MPLRDLLRLPKFVMVLSLLFISTAGNVIVTKSLIERQQHEQEIVQQSRALSLELLEARTAEYRIRVDICETKRMVEFEEHTARLSEIRQQVDSMRTRVDSILQDLNMASL